MTDTEERQGTICEQDRQRLAGLTLMDDEFMTAFFRDDTEDTEFILRIILGRPELTVKNVHVQHELKNLNGRSVRLDIHATDISGNEVDIEIQQESGGAGFKRARYNSSLLDASILKPGYGVEELPETYVIFITQTDVIGSGEPIYPIERYMFVNGKYIPVCDGAHIIYVNGAKKGNGTALEKLMHDFMCANADDMFYSNIARKMRYLKESEKGGRIMSKVFDEMREEAALRTRIENALAMIENGKLSLEEIAQCSGLPLEKVRELGEKKSA